MPLSEFDLIERYFRHGSSNRSDVVVGVGDDAAILRIPPGSELVSVTGTLAGVLSDTPGNLGHHALAMNVSRLAAMGAEPAWATLALTLPEADAAWLDPFSRELMQLANRLGIQLVGGDMTRGPLTISVVAHGTLPEGQAIGRSGARAGDLVYLTGAVGEAGLVIADTPPRLLRLQDTKIEVHERTDRPEPRVTQGCALRGLASAAVDLPEGLIKGLETMLKGKDLGATFHVQQPPTSGGGAADQSEEGPRTLPIRRYELCFTIAPSQRSVLEERLAQIPGTCLCIGQIDQTEGLRCVDQYGKHMHLDETL